MNVLQRIERGEYNVFPATVECKGLSKVVYSVGGSQDDNQH